MCGRKSFPSIVEIDKKLSVILNKHSMQTLSNISLKQFQSLVSKDADVLQLLKSYNFVLSDDLRDVLEDDKLPAQIDSDLDDELDEKEKIVQLKPEQLNQLYAGLTTDIIDQRKVAAEGYKINYYNDDTAKPSTFKSITQEKRSPELNIEPTHVFGFRGYDQRNNIKISTNSDLILYSGKTAVVINKKQSSSKIFLTHNQEISNMAVYETYVATGEFGDDPTIHIWDSKNLQLKFSLKGILKKGINFLRFSHDGKKLAAMEIDHNHTVVVYDFAKVLSGKATEYKEQVLGIYKGPEKAVFDMDFDHNDNFLLFACKDSLGFIPIRQEGATLLEYNNWPGNSRNLLSLGSNSNVVIAGMQSGQIVSFKTATITETGATKGPGQAQSERLVTVYAFSSFLTEQHGGACGAIWSRKNDRGFITGGYDGSVYVWDATLNKAHNCMINEDAKLVISSLKIKSICEDSSGEIYIGTKAGFLHELTPAGGGFSNKIILKGHLGDISCVDRLGLKDEIISVGNDKSLFVWDLAKNKEKRSLQLDFDASQVASSLDGSHIAVGFNNGYIHIIETGSGNYNTNKKIKDRTSKILLLKYSSINENNMLAAGGEDCEIILYKVKENYKMHLKIKGLSGPPAFLDFSADNSLIRVVDLGLNLRFYSVDDKKKKTESLMYYKDTRWTSANCPVTWETHGLLSDPSILAGMTCMAVSPNSKILAVGMSSGDIRFYPFPCIGMNPPYVNFMAHASPVVKILFSNQDLKNELQYTLISISKRDRNIITWKYTPPPAEKIQGAMVSQGPMDLDEKHYLSLLNKTTKTDSLIKKDNQTNHVPKVFETDSWNISKRQGEAPDQSLELKYIFGCKFQGVVNFAKFTTGGSVVFFSGNKAIVEEVNKEPKVQSFFTHHRNEILSMDIHKNKELIATGEIAEPNEHGKVYVWHYQTRAIVSALTTAGTGGAIKVKFSSEGTKLLVVNNDQYHTLDVFDYINGRLITSVLVDERPILEISFKSDNDFVTLTSLGPRFWELKGTNLVSTNGDWKALAEEKDTKRDDGSSGAEQMVSCLYAFLQNICVIGTVKGNLYAFQNHLYHKQATAHSKAVRVMHCFKNMLYTCGDDGIIKTWSYTGKLSMIKQIPINIPIENSIQFEIRSLDINSADSSYLIGTNTAKLFIQNDSGSGEPVYLPVCESHASEGINALAVHPTTHHFITAANDGRLIKWDVVTKSCTIHKPVFRDPNQYIVALDWSLNGEFIAAATNKGKVCLLDKSLTVKDTEADSNTKLQNQRISVIKISPNFSRVAVSAENLKEILFYDINEKDLRITLGPVLHLDLAEGCRFLDWTDDGEFVACTLDSYDIQFGMMKDMKIAKYVTVKDKFWSTWTQPLGPTVKGIKLDDSDIKYSPVCRSHKFVTKARDHDTEIEKKPIRLFLVAGDRAGNLSLYRYPSIYPNSDAKTYNVFPSNITQVRIFSNDKFVVAINDQDNSVAIFETDFKDDINKIPDNVEAILGGEPDESGADPNAESLPRASAKKKSGALRKEDQASDNKDVSLMYREDQGIMEKQKFSRPWMASIRYPTGYLKPPINSEKSPKIRLKPYYVFGFRAKDTRDNLKYLNQNEVAYATGSLIVIHNINGKTNTQRFFSEHRADVSCFTVRQNPFLVASGDLSEPPVIYIWNPESLAILRTIKTEGIRGLAKIQFAPDGPYLATLSIDDHSTVSVFNYITGVLLHSVPGDGVYQRIHDLKWMNMNEFATVGINHIKFWKVEVNQIKSTRGKLDVKAGQQRMVCCAINKKDVLAGTVRGDLLVWKRGMGNDSPQIYPIMSDKQEKGCAIECISVTDQCLFIAGREGLVYVWTNGYKEMLRVSYLNENDILSGRVRSIDTINDGKKIIVGTSTSEIIELSSSDLKLSQNSKYGRSDINKGPFTPDSVERYEMWGLAVHRLNEKTDKFLTCSDDGYLRYWSIKGRVQTQALSLERNVKGEIVPKSDDAKLRCISLSNREDYAAVGCKSGLIRIVSVNTEMNQTQVIDITKSCIRDLKFSPSGQWLAVGAEPNVFELYTTSDYKRRANLKKHMGPVNHLDWSQDSSYVQATSDSQELLFFSAQDSQHLTEIKPIIRDEKWNTQSCVYSWSLQGIWKDGMTLGTEVNMADRSNGKFFKEYQAVATGDDFSQVNVYKYPCVQSASESVTGHGHSSLVSNVKWTFDDKFLISTGGEDQTIIIWEVEKLS